MNYYLLIPATAFLVDFFLMTYLLAASDRHRARRAYLLFCFSIMIWQASEFFLWTSLSDDTVLRILKLTSPFYLSVGFLFLNFIHDFTRKKRGVIFYVFAALLFPAVMLAIFTDGHISPVILRYHWGTTPILGPLYLHIVIATMLLPVLRGMIILARHYCSSDDHIIRRQSLLIFTGLFITSTTALITNVILPLRFSDYSFPRLASSLMAIQSVFIFISIVRYRLFMISFEKNAYRIYNSIQDGVIILDRQRQIFEINETASKIIGITSDGAKGRHLKEILPEVFDVGSDQPNRLLDLGPEDNRQSVLISRSDIMHDRITTGTLIIMKDITAIRRAEIESRLYQERFSKAFNLSPIPMAINRISDTVYVDVNESQVRQSGYSREDFIGKSIYDIALFVNDHEFRRIRRRLLINGKVSNLDCSFRLKNGEIRNTLFSAEVFTIEGVEYVISCTVDITDRIKMESELLKASKLESLGVFAGGIAHDFNNLLTAIVGNISLAKIIDSGNESTAGILNEAERASLRAKDLTRQLLTFSRGGAPVRRIASLTDILTDSSNFALIGSALKCRIRIPDDLWHANIDEGQITQVFHNIILNARQSMTEGGVIYIDAENMEIHAGDSTGAHPGLYVHVSIRDEGKGISTENISKIFDPFFSTGENGTGLGLTISYSIIRRHEGLITVESQPGTGTTFHVYLPAVETRAEEKPEDPVHHGKGCGRIMVVDDEESVLKVACEMLDRMGYTAVPVTSGDRAIELYVAALGTVNCFDCVIIDLTIPGGIGGREIITRLREIDPVVTAIVSSGYSHDQVLANFRDYGFSGIIPKPYSFHEMKTVMESIMKSV